MKEKEEWVKHLQLGLELSFYVLIFLFSGYWIDMKFLTKPFFTIFGAGVGIFAVFYVLWRNFIRGKNG